MTSDFCVFTVIGSELVEHGLQLVVGIGQKRKVVCKQQLWHSEIRDAREHTVPYNCGGYFTTAASSPYNSTGFVLTLYPGRPRACHSKESATYEELETTVKITC
jgi:hypothetical protein